MPKKVTKDEMMKVGFIAIFGIFLFMASKGVSEFLVSLLGDSWKLIFIGIAGLIFLVWYFDLSKYPFIRK